MITEESKKLPKTCKRNLVKPTTVIKLIVKY